MTRTVSVCETCDAGYDQTLERCPYCNTHNMMSHPQTLTPLIIDTECYRTYWLMLAYAPDTDTLYTFQTFDGYPLDTIGMRNVLTKHTLVTFNGIGYDLPMITYAMTGASTQQLKAASDDIIVGQLKHWNFYRQYGLASPDSLDHIDLIEVAPGEGSLKAYGGKMHTRKLQDLPYPPDMHVEWPHRVMLREYCRNDIQVTLELYRTFTAQLQLREDMGAEYGVELRSKSDPQIAEAVMKTLLDFKVDRPSVEVGRQFIYQAPEWLIFEDLPVLEWLAQAPFAITESGMVSPAIHATFIDWPDKQLRLDAHGSWVGKPKGWVHKPIVIGQTSYAMGSGGLHSMESKITWRADAQKSLRMPDVEAYYPNLIVKTQIFPKQIGPIFLTHYKGWKDRRTAAKKIKDKKTANSLKTLNNGTFGKLFSKYSIFYTPEGGITVTITGQLALLMLICALEKAGISVVSANTDGIVVFTDRANDWMTDSIIQWWEGVTGFTMEIAEYSMLAARDVNTYVGIEASGDVKLKGAFAPPLPGASGWPNPTGQVCVDAVVAYLQHNTQVADTIRACNDVRQFVYVRSVTGGAIYHPAATLPKKATQTFMRSVVGDIRDKVALTEAYDVAYASSMAQGEYLGKVVRWYYGIGSQACMTTKTGSRVARTEGCRPMMTLTDDIPEDLDYDWYIAEAASLLVDIGITRV